MIGETNNGFEKGEAVPAKLLLEGGELIDPAAVEPMPIATGGEAAELAGEFVREDWRAGVVDHRRKNPAKAVVSAYDMAQQRASLFGNEVEQAGVCLQ